jgi:integrase
MYSVYHAGRYWPVDGVEQDALIKQAELRGRTARGERLNRPSAITFAEVAKAFMDVKHDRLRESTFNTYQATLRRLLIPRFGELKIGALTVENVAVLIRDLERQGLTPKTIQAYIATLRGVMVFALRRGHIQSNPCDLLTRDDRPRPREPKPDHIWSDEEIEGLIAAARAIAEQPKARYNYAPLIAMALYTGLRLGELLGLTWQDIDIGEGVLYVRRQWLRTGVYGPPKTKAGLRRLPLSTEMTKSLAAHKLNSRHSGDNDPVFASKNGRPLAHRNVTRRGFVPAAKKAGIAGVSFHDMRHAFASRMIHRGISPTVLAKLMGHESSAITEKRYVHLFDQKRTDNDVRKAMSRERIRN